MVDSLGQVIVEGVEEEFLGLSRDALILNQGVGHIVRSHAIKQELVVCCILGFIFRALKVVTDEVPECITDEGIEVEQVDDVLELVPRLGLCLQEVHTCNNVFLSKIKVNKVRDKFKIETLNWPGSTPYLDVLKFDLGRKV